MSKSIYSTEHMKLVQTLKNIREDLHLTQAEVAKKLNKPQSFISKIESGQKKIDLEDLRGFSKVYSKKIAFFLDEE